MAEAEELTPIEMKEGIADEAEYIEKLREHFKEDFELVHDFDVRRVIRGYAKEAERWKDTVEHLQIWIDCVKKGFANVGFKPLEDQDMYKKLVGWAGITCHGEDKFGHPVMYEDVANYDCAKIQENLEAALQYRSRVFSQMWNKKHQTSKKTGKMVYKQLNIFNLKNIGVMSANKFKAVVQKCIAREGDQFPETVYKMYFINTNFWFKAAWAVISMFVHPATKAKIQMLGSDYVKQMQDDVSLDQIPKEFNGTCNEPIRWGESWFQEPAEAQFPDLLKNAKEVQPPAYDDVPPKEKVENEPEKVEST